MSISKPWALGLLLAAGGAQASTTLYTDSGVFATALTALGESASSVDFAAAGAANGVTDSTSYGVGDPSAIDVGAVSFAGGQAGNAAGFLAQDTYGLAGVFYTHQIFNGTDNSVNLTFASPITALALQTNALNFTVSGPDGPLPVTVTTSAGDVLNTVTSPLYWGGVDLGTAPLAFIGLISDAPLTSVTFSLQAQAFDVTQASVVSVPEPSLSVLAFAGLALLGWSRRRLVEG